MQQTCFSLLLPPHTPENSGYFTLKKAQEGSESREERKTGSRTSGIGRDMGVSSLDFLSSSHILDWLLEKEVSNPRPSMATHKTAPRKACSLHPKDKKRGN